MIYKSLKKENTASFLAAAALFIVAAVFSIGIILAFFDYGSASAGQSSFLAALGHIVAGAFGISSLLIPLFFFVSGVFCLDYNWSVQRAFCLLVSVIPFFTVVAGEKWIRSVLENYNGGFAIIAITGIAALIVFLVMAEYLVTLVFAGLLEAKIELSKRRTVSEKEADELDDFFDSSRQNQQEPSVEESEYENVELEDRFEEPSVNSSLFGSSAKNAKAEEKPSDKVNEFIKNSADKLKQFIQIEDNSDSSLEKKDSGEVDLDEFFGKEDEAQTEVEEDFDVADSDDFTYSDDAVNPDDIDEDSLEYEDDESNGEAETVAQDAETLEEDGTFYTPKSFAEKKENVFVRRVIVSDDEGIPVSMQESVDEIKEDKDEEREAAQSTEDKVEEFAEETEDFEFDPSLEKKGTFVTSEAAFLKEPLEEPFVQEDDAVDSSGAENSPPEQSDTVQKVEPYQTQEVVHNLTPSRKGHSLLSALDDVFAKMDDDAKAQVEDGDDDLLQTASDFPKVKKGMRNLAAEIDSAENESDIEDLDNIFDASQDSEEDNASYEQDETEAAEDAEGDDSFAEENEVYTEDESFGERETGISDSEAEEVKESSAVQNPIFAKTAVVTDSNGTRPINIPEPKRHKTGPYAISSDLLTAYEDDPYWIIDEETQNAAHNLEATLEEFKIKAEVTGIRKGPVVTMFEMLPAPGVKLSKIVALQDNIALRLAASSVRIVAPIPGKRAVGIEVPNRERSIVSFRECIEQDRPEWKKMAVPVVLGKDIQGETQIIDLVKTPHLLIAGSTGAGKSVCVNSMILSVLFKRSPNEVKLIMIDPKIVELKLYNDIPHLLTPVITEPKRAMQALQYCLCEMERRYALLDGMGVRDISTYNKKITERRIATEKLPYLLVVIDEFADLMATTGKQLEGVIARLAAMSRAVGIHLVLATQRPSIDVITGLIKANIPSRIAFMVASKTDSRIIIDQVGAEKLLGKGDMLYASATDPFPKRIQGTFISDQEVENVVGAVKEWGEPEYIDDEIFVEDDDDEDSDMAVFSGEGEDPLYEKALDIVVQAGKASASYIQRRLKIGYNRAARLVEEMEERGIVGPANGSKPREVIHIP